MGKVFRLEHLNRDNDPRLNRIYEFNDVRRPKQAADNVIEFYLYATNCQQIPIDLAPPLSKDSGLTDAANAQRLIAKYRSQIRWVAGWDRWIVWDGQRWRIDDELQMEARAKNTAAGLWKQIAAVGNDGDLLKSMSYFAYSNSKNGVVNMVALARSEPDVPITVDELDRNPWLLNVANGTLDLRTGKLLPHDRRTFLTKLAPVTFNPAATCDLWIKFLDRIFADDGELIGYLQRLVGYRLPATFRSTSCPFSTVMEPTANQFVEVCLRMLGPDYSMKAPPDLLLAKRGESHPTERLIFTASGWLPALKQKRAVGWQNRW